MLSVVLNKTVLFNNLHPVLWSVLHCVVVRLTLVGTSGGWVESADFFFLQNPGFLEVKININWVILTFYPTH